MQARRKVAILYHFMHPDDVVSAQHLDGLAEDLTAQGWLVEALPCNRGCRDETKTYRRHEVHNGVTYNRVSRPRFRQASFFGRLANSCWMIAKWTGLALRPQSRRPDLVIVGTDPMFGALVAIPLRLLAPNIKLVHWCFDLHPEAAEVSGTVAQTSAALKAVKAAMRMAYRRYDAIVDIGVCMRRLLRLYDHGARELELTPWALVEPEQPTSQDAEVRRELFGDARVGVLYSGNFGEAHDHEQILRLARRLRHRPDIHFCFAVRGNRADALKAAVTEEDTNISFAGFAPIEMLEKRLGSADIHMASLFPEWSGVAVPSKFFGSLATGRPVLYAGPQDSAIANWIDRYDIGWTLTPETLDLVASQLEEASNHPKTLASIQQRCFETYQTQFSRAKVTGEWNRLVEASLAD